MKVVFKDGNYWNLYRLPFSRQFMNKIESYFPGKIKDVKEINYVIQGFSIINSEKLVNLNNGDYLGVTKDRKDLFLVSKEDIKDFKKIGMLDYGV